MVTYRSIREEEIREAVDLFHHTLEDLAVRKGIALLPFARGPWERGYRHVLATGTFEVAEANGRIVAICHATLRGSLWFLSGFWTLPEYQGRSVGAPMLRRSLAWGVERGATAFFTWSSIDVRAMGLYMKVGMLPGSQILTFAGRPRDALTEERDYHLRSIDVAVASSIDEQARGARREVDHQFWIDGGAHGGIVEKGGEAIGYFYEAEGAVGPAAWTKPDHASTVLAAALDRARSGDRPIRLIVPGANHEAIRFSLGQGLRLVAFAHLLTSLPGLRFESYLPSGPTLF